MIIGFTGTRNGMTLSQRNAVCDILSELGGVFVGLHGSCVGADEHFDELCRQFGCKTTARPCTAPPDLIAKTGARAIAEPTRPMKRNRAIVADADVMIACPPNRSPIKSGSGTWATVGLARRARRPLFIVYPEGDIEEERTGGVRERDQRDD